MEPLPIRHPRNHNRAFASSETVLLSGRLTALDELAFSPQGRLTSYTTVTPVHNLALHRSAHVDVLAPIGVPLSCEGYFPPKGAKKRNPRRKLTPIHQVAGQPRFQCKWNTNAFCSVRCRSAPHKGRQKIMADGSWVKINGCKFFSRCHFTPLTEFQNTPTHC